MFGFHGGPLAGLFGLAAVALTVRAVGCALSGGCRPRPGAAPAPQ